MTKLATAPENVVWIGSCRDGAYVRHNYRDKIGRVFQKVVSVGHGAVTWYRVK